MRVAFITDRDLSDKCAPTVQLVCTASALATAGLEVILVPPYMPRRMGAEELAMFYHVAPAFSLAAAQRKNAAPLRTEIGKAAHIWQALASIRKLRCDAIYTRDLRVAVGALARSSLPIFYETYRRWPKYSRRQRLLFRLLRHRRRLVGLILHSELAARSYSELGYAPERLLVAYNGIDPRQFSARLSREAARARLGLSAEIRPLVVYTGSVVPAKGLDHVLNAAEQLPELAFALVGLRTANSITARSVGLPNVRIYPWCDEAEIPSWLAAADVLLIPPTSGPLEKARDTVLPIKTFEYLAAGRAIIAPSTPDNVELLTNSVNARLVPPDDLVSFIGALRSLGADPARRARLGDAARSGASYTWDRRAVEIRDFLGARLRPAAFPLICNRREPQPPR